jgi:acyl-CoA dehydrogenase
MTQELSLIVETAQRVVNDANSLPTEHERVTKSLEMLGKLDFFAIALPAPLGQGSLEGAAAVARVCSQAEYSVPYAETALIAAPMLAVAGLQVPAGPLTATAATHAVVDDVGGRLRVRARATRVPWARDVSHIVVLVPMEDGEALLAVECDKVRITPGENIAGEPRNLIDIDLEVPDGSWVELPSGAGRELRLRGALARAAGLAAVAETVRDLTVRYAGQRSQFGRAIGRFQAVQHAVVELAAEAAIMRASADAAVSIAASGGFASDVAASAIAVAKAQAGASATRVARIAHQIHGAMGTTREHPLHRFTTRLWSWRDDFGLDGEWAQEVSRAALRSDPWTLITM